MLRVIEDYSKVINDLKFHPCTGGVQGGLILQRPQETENFINWAIQIQPKKILEIGLDKGGFSQLMRRVLGSDMFGITLTVRDDASYFHENLKWINCDSNSEEAVKWAKENGPYDILIIDADHSDKNVQYEWDNYKEFAKWIVFCDIDSPSVSGPRNVFNSINLEKFTIIDHPEPNTYSCGFGIVRNEKYTCSE